MLRDRDAPSWMDEDVPQDILDRSNVKQELLDGAHGPLSRFLVKRWIGEKDPRAIIKALRGERRPKDVIEQQQKVAAAQALVFISRVWFVGFPAILKGWFDRVFTLGFFNEETYRAGFGDAMTHLMADWGLRYPGIRQVDHVFFYAVNGATDETRRNYLDRAYSLGRDFTSSSSVAAA